MTPNDELWRVFLCIILGSGFLIAVLSRAFRKETYYKIMIVIFIVMFVLECTVWREHSGWIYRIMMLVLAYNHYWWLKKIRS